MCFVRIGDWPIYDSRHECAEHRMHADEIGEQRQRDHQHEDDADDRHLDDEAVIHPADDARDPAVPERETNNEENDRPADADEHRPEDDLSVRGEPADERENRPADGVVQDRCGEDDLAEIAPEEIHLAQHGGDDLHRGNRERRREEKRCDHPTTGIGKDALGQHLAERVAARKRDENSGGGDDGSHAAHAFHEREIRLHAGEQQQHEHAQLGHRAQHRPIGGFRRKYRLLSHRPDCPENARTQRDSREQLTDHGGLPDPLHGFTQKPAGENQQRDLREENHELVVALPDSRREQRDAAIEQRRVKIGHRSQSHVLN